MDRNESLRRIYERTTPFDLLIIGGGATGVGVAMDAASRGYDVALIEQADFGKGTSSRSTKLVHGGVRYLQQGNITLVRDALRERTLLRRNAPHLVHDMPFVIPCEHWWQKIYFGIGLKLYDLLAWSDNFGSSHGASQSDIARDLPTLAAEKFSGGVVYHDGQFDDSRLLINMARTAADHGASLVNGMGATELVKNDDGRIVGVVAVDHETSETVTIRANTVINAAGPFCDAVRRMDKADCQPMLAASQGVHVVLPRSFFPGDVSLIVPKTSDGRVLFIIPWHDRVLVGTTDTPIPTPSLEPVAQEQEIQFLLDTTSEYLTHPPTRSDVRSVFVGIRPLVRGDKSARTASLSRDHVIRVEDSGLMTITGGKWTTVRKMAEDCVDRAITVSGLAKKPCVTPTLHLHGYAAETNADVARSFYGSDLAAIEQLESDTPDLARRLSDDHPIHRSEVVWAVRHEMARTVDDVLARRTRLLLLDADAAVAVCGDVARLIADELGHDDAWCADQVAQFTAMARQYQIQNFGTPAT
ncbi:Aerobic glycerol-3-phosphate dehydrogenase [Rubripirellula lacrimiformis]|uniref:Glycerol-3-phosphate dehydrogenase n=1 Tax=Rubripirellula lacrimiformis TaxID=1930273 RepID=A0A517NLK5_9BACT|nr:FAD-dependent oxidoreductase [Rubripirellula lacrimiformis]QDT07953.1 Aerobic glycerol-3-phosphate dehydrogenase [Rubripirellula lacrimiformis]